jgi:hypothetical protein
MSVKGATPLDAVIPEAALYGGEDRVPEPTSDATEPAASIVREPAPVAAAPEPEEPKQPTLVVDPRQAIAERFKARRAAQPQAEQIDPYSAPVDAAHEGAPAQVEQPNPLIPPLPPKTYTLKVYAKDLTVSREDLLAACEMDESDAAGIPDEALVRMGQKNVAFQMKLDSLKKRAAPPAFDDGDFEPQPTEEQRRAAPTPRQAEPEDKELIRQIQLGDEDEAADAFDKLFQRRQQAARTADSAASLRQELNTTIEDFGKRNPDIASDDVAADLLRTLSTREAVKELASKVSLPEHEIKQLLNDPNLAARAYQGARLQGYQLRPTSELFEAAGQTVRERLNMPTQTSNGQASIPAQQHDRIAMKRALPTQPARSGGVDLARPPQPKADNRDPSATIAKMRAARFQ